MRALVVRVTFALVTGLPLVSSCSNDSSSSQPPTTTTSDQSQNTIDLGELGSLPAPPDVPHGGPKLVMPETIVEVPGEHPLGAVVVFRLPIRNDGDQPLIVSRLEPG